jgi:hypothetical protein
MKSTKLKRVIVFLSTADYRKGLELLREDIHWEYSGFLHGLNFYTVCEFDLAIRRLNKSGMEKHKNFVVHA